MGGLLEILLYCPETKGNGFLKKQVLWARIGVVAMVWLGSGRVAQGFFLAGYS